MTETTDANGTVKRCRITRKYTVCSELPTVKDDGTSDDWKTPDSTYQDCHECAASTPYFRNGECVALCGQTNYTMAFESVFSNNCISCETTAYQGIIQTNEKGDITNNGSGIFNVCMKCDPKTQLFVAGEGCKSKSADFTQISKQAMRDCWTAGNSAMYRCCIQLGKDYLDAYEKDLSSDKKTQFENCITGTQNNT